MTEVRNSGLNITEAPEELKPILAEASKTVFRGGPFQIMADPDSMARMSNQAEALAAKAGIVGHPKLAALFTGVRDAASQLLNLLKDATDTPLHALKKETALKSLIDQRRALWSELCSPSTLVEVGE